MLFERHSLTLKSYAKINLSLRVISKRPDGYHELEMVNLPLELHDVISIEKTPAGSGLYVTCDDVALSNTRHNLCTKMSMAMKERFAISDDYNIEIHKEIPYAAGMGGGSSNAAAVMKGMVELSHVAASNEELVQLGASLGADIPFFMYGKPCLVKGIGEQLTPIAVKKKYFCLIVKPNEGLSTKAVYEACDNFERNQKINTKNVIDALKFGDDALLAHSIGNDLYEPGISLCPKVGEIVNRLKQDGLAISNMTGSGSACFALSSDPKKLKEEARKFEKEGLFTIVTKVIV